MYNAVLYKKLDASAGPVRARSESSHMDVKPWTGIKPKSCSIGIGKLPSMALDTGIPYILILFSQRARIPD
jgi:hypothetical protein